MKRLISALLAACTLASGALAGASYAGPPNRTPSLGEVFNGYTIGALQNGRLATPGELLKPFAPNDPFYDEPRLTGDEKPGTLLKAQRVAVQYTGFRPANLDAYKTMYVTESRTGEPDISTGIIMIPRDGRNDADRKIIGYQFANDSVGGYCHPSGMMTGANPMDGASMSAMGPLALMFGKGYAVVISDVGNNGDTSPHGVFAGKYNAKTTLDGLRAALALKDAGLSAQAPIGLFGIAGGGVGIGHASEMKDSYAPELNIRSAVLEGMVVNYKNFIRTSSGSVGSGFAMATLLGLEPSYPEMKIDEKLTPAGRQVADFYRGQCQTPGYFTLPFVPLQTMFTSGQHPADIADFQFAYRDNIMGEGTPGKGIKTLIASCVADDSPMSLVPAADSRKLTRQWRSRGAKVDYQPTDCSMVEFITNMYGWGTDLFGMQTIDWLDANTRN